MKDALDRRKRALERSTAEERRRSNWSHWFRVICERGIEAGKSDDAIMHGILDVNRERCRELLAIVRAEHEARVKVA